MHNRLSVLRLVKFGTYCVGFNSIVVLVSYYVRSSRLASWVDGLTPMAIPTAIMFVLVAILIWLLADAVSQIVEQKDERDA